MLDPVRIARWGMVRRTLAVIVGLAICFAALWSGAGLRFAAAQGLNLMSENGDGPLEIDADDGLEWRRDARQYIARGNARAKRGTVSLEADVLTAHYRESDEGDTEIWRIDADGNVRIASPTEEATGDRGVYDVNKGHIILIGDGLRLRTPTDTITARDSLEYFDIEKRAIARGDALAARDTRTVRAETLTANFRDDGKGGLVASRVIANSNVCIQSGTDIARGQFSDYDVDGGIAILRRNVRVQQGNNYLRGENAEVNFNTGVSRMLAAPGGSRRVGGVIIPGAGGDDAANRGAAIAGGRGQPKLAPCR